MQDDSLSRSTALCFDLDHTAGPDTLYNSLPLSGNIPSFIVVRTSSDTDRGVSCLSGIAGEQRRERELESRGIQSKTTETGGSERG